MIIIISIILIHSSKRLKMWFVILEKSPGETVITEISDILKEAETGRTESEILIEAQKGDIPPSLRF